MKLLFRGFSWILQKETKELEVIGGQNLTGLFDYRE